MLTVTLINKTMFTGVIAGLERVAEELMGRRKWALYQDVLSTSIHRHDAQPDYIQQQAESTDLQSEIHAAEQNSATGAFKL